MCIRDRCEVIVRPAADESLAKSLLAEPQTPYDHLVQAMDTVRSSVRPDGAKLVRAELFPHISIGDAPVRRDAAARLAVPPARGAG